MEGIHFNPETAFTNYQPSPVQIQRIDRVLLQSKGLAETFILECGGTVAATTPEVQLALSLLQQATFAVRQAIMTSSGGRGQTGHAGQQLGG